MRHRIGSICVFIGTLLILGAIGLYAYNYWDDWRAGQSVSEVQDRLSTAQENYLNTNSPSFRLDSNGLKRPDDGEMPVIVVDDYEYIGTLSIPRYGLELPVMSEWSYPGLKIAPGRYSGSAWTDDLVICGHNYERHFGNLRYLEDGDPVTFTDVLGNVFSYEVVLVETLSSTAVEEMTSGIWDLTLFTCTVGGRARVAVRCMRSA